MTNLEMRHREVLGSMAYGQRVPRMVTEVRCALCGGWHDFLASREEKLGVVEDVIVLFRPAHDVQHHVVPRQLGQLAQVETVHHKRRRMRMWRTRTWKQLVGARCADAYRRACRQLYTFSPFVDAAEGGEIPYLPMDVNSAGMGAYRDAWGNALPWGEAPPEDTGSARQREANPYPPLVEFL